jgi:1-acyl-sn-glycerol-3-phosphate acyltransferase
MTKNPMLDKVFPLLAAARLYHRHEVVGLEHIPLEGRALVVANHSLATYDIILLMTAIYQDLHRLPRPLIDRLFFRIPYLGDVASLFGAVQGSQETAEELLSGDHIVTVAPGGMREALRPSSQRYQILWDRRIGFVKLAMRTRSPVILAACPKADDLYDIYPSKITAWAYKNFKVPVFFARGLGPSPIPRPIKLVHYLSEPMLPPEMSEDEEENKKRAKTFHSKLVKRMHTLIGEAIQQR